MTQNIQENERKIFAAIQHLKDSIFGLTQSFSDFCFDINQEGKSIVSETKLRSFVEDLTLRSHQSSDYDNAFCELSPLFFEMSIRYLLAACNPSDWQFISIKKLAATLHRQGDGYKSTFDFMVEDMHEYLEDYWQGDEFRQLYSKYSTLINGLSYEECVSFEKCVKAALERFIDAHYLNSLVNDFETQAIVSKINRTASIIHSDLRKARGVTIDGNR